MSIRLNYTSATSTWNWVDYIANDADTRYLKTSTLGVTVQGYDADTAKLDVTQEFTSQQTFSGMAVFNGITAFGSSSSVGFNSLVVFNNSSSVTFNTSVDFNNDVTFSSTQTYPKTPLVAVNANRTITGSDAGKTLVRTAGDITFPAALGPDLGDLITIYNDGSTDCNLTRDPGGSTFLQTILLKAGSTTTKDFVLKPGGIVTVLMLQEGNQLITAAKYVISGVGVF